jgi:hypothetical protein
MVGEASPFQIRQASAATTLIDDPLGRDANVHYQRSTFEGEETGHN